MIIFYEENIFLKLSQVIIFWMQACNMIQSFMKLFIINIFRINNTFKMSIQTAQTSVDNKMCAK